MFAAMILIIVSSFVGYYSMSYSAVGQVSFQIISGTRMMASSTDYNYTLQIRISAPGALMPIKLWPPSISLSLDSYYLGGTGPCRGGPPDDYWVHLNPGDSLTCNIVWHSWSLNSNPTGQTALARSTTNHLQLWVYFHQAEGGWYNTEILRSISTRSWK